MYQNPMMFMQPTSNCQQQLYYQQGQNFQQDMNTFVNFQVESKSPQYSSYDYMPAKGYESLTLPLQNTNIQQYNPQQSNNLYKKDVGYLSIETNIIGQSFTSPQHSPQPSPPKYFQDDEDIDIFCLNNNQQYQQQQQQQFNFNNNNQLQQQQQQLYQEQQIQQQQDYIREDIQQQQIIQEQVKQQQNVKRQSSQNDSDFDIVSLMDIGEETQPLFPESEVDHNLYRIRLEEIQKEIIQKEKHNILPYNYNIAKQQLQILIEYHCLEEVYKTQLNKTFLYNRINYIMKKSKQANEDYSEFEANYEYSSQKKPQLQKKQKKQNKFTHFVKCQSCQESYPKALIYFHQKFIHDFQLPQQKKQSFVKQSLQQFEKIKKQQKIDSSNPSLYSENTYLQVKALQQAYSKKQSQQRQQQSQKKLSHFLRPSLVFLGQKVSENQVEKVSGTYFNDEVLQDLMNTIISPENNINLSRNTVNNQQQNEVKSIKFQQQQCDLAKQQQQKQVIIEFLNNNDFTTKNSICSLSSNMKLKQDLQENFFNLPESVQLEIIYMLKSNEFYQVAAKLESYINNNSQESNIINNIAQQRSILYRVQQNLEIIKE